MICWNPWACYPHIVLIIYRGSATSGWFDCHNENVSDFKNYSGRRPFWPPWPISFPPHIHTLPPPPPPECVISRPTSRDPCDGCLGKSKFMTPTWSFIFVSCLFYLIISFFYLFFCRHCSGLVGSRTLVASSKLLVVQDSFDAGSVWCPSGCSFAFHSHAQNSSCSAARFALLGLSSRFQRQDVQCCRNALQGTRHPAPGRIIFCQAARIGWFALQLSWTWIEYVAQEAVGGQQFCRYQHIYWASREFDSQFQQQSGQY